ncbi:MAG TPA: hypothetical protein VKT32_00800, partial [Chthonomonadaceae bacterium]|nr:hypothetical protein [Chthonomonadaceae bacterium]
MNARLVRRLSQDGRPWVWPLSGVAIVFLRRMRSRNAWRDLIGVVLNLVGLLVIAAILQSVWLVMRTEYNNDIPHFLLRCQCAFMAGASLLLLPCAAVLGAGAVPSSMEFEATQTALLTRLTAFDLCAGRLLAGLWVLIASLLASCAFWLIANLFAHFSPGAGHGFGAIFAAHFVLLTVVLMMGAVGFLFGLRRKPGRNWGRGTAVAVLTAAFCITALLLANPLITRLDEPKRLIEASLLINPVSATTTTFNLDILRTHWL